MKPNTATVRLMELVSVLVTAACRYPDPVPQVLATQPASGPVYIPVGSYPGTAAVPVVASAPAWVEDERFLGVLFDDSFHPLEGSQAKVNARVYRNPAVENGCVEFDSAQAFRATVSAGAGFDIGPLSVGIGVSESDYVSQYRRFLHCLWFRHDRTVEAQQDIDLSRTPADVQYVLTKIQFGWSDEYIAENVASLTQNDFKASADVGFAHFKVGGSVGTSNLSYNGSVRWYQRKRGGGVQPSIAMPAEPAQPVLVEYRELCGAHGCISPGRYRISDFPLKFWARDLYNKPWDSNDSGLDLVLSVFVDGRFVGKNCEHQDIERNQYNCAQDLQDIVIDLRNKHSRIEFHAIDDDDDGPYAPGHHHDEIGTGVVDFAIGSRAGAPLAFTTNGAIESASIALEPL